MTIYDIPVTNIHGATLSLEGLKEKVLLIVNTATQCGYARQFPGLEELNQKYKKDGLEVLLFPSDQFKQEPGTDEELHEIYRNDHKSTAKVFAKADVNGPNANPLFTYLKEQKGYDNSEKVSEAMQEYYRKFDPDFENNSDIKWNFTKFLVARDGTVIGRYEPEVTPEMLENEIRDALL